MPNPQQTPAKFLKVSDVIEQTSLSRTTIWRKVKAGEFPRAHPISSGRVAWISTDIDRWKDEAQSAAI